MFYVALISHMHARSLQSLSLTSIIIYRYDYPSSHSLSLPAHKLRLGLSRISDGCLQFYSLVDWSGIAKAKKERKIPALEFEFGSSRGSAATTNGGRVGSNNTFTR
jgi:hypothetical protein